MHACMLTVERKLTVTVRVAFRHVLGAGTTPKKGSEGSGSIPFLRSRAKLSYPCLSVWCGCDRWPVCHSFRFQRASSDRCHARAAIRTLLWLCCLMITAHLWLVCGEMFVWQGSVLPRHPLQSSSPISRPSCCCLALTEECGNQQLNRTLHLHTMSLHRLFMGLERTERD